MRHIVPISGKDSLATALLMRAKEPDLPYEYIYNDTLMELPETYAWLAKIEAQLGFEIKRIGKDLEHLIYDRGILPGPKTRYCTIESKIHPMRDFIKGDEATIYIGIRADEDRTGLNAESNMIVRYPLKEANVDLKAVLQIMRNFNVAPPSFYWPRLHSDVESAMLDAKFVIAELPGLIFDRMFAWRSRPNCFMCFYQRRYEWAGLLDMHPTLFDRAEEIERKINEGSDRAEYYSWIGDGWPLSRVRKEKDRLIESRVVAIVKLLRDRQQKELFFDATVDDMDLAQKSCGLFCGK